MTQIRAENTGMSAKATFVVGFQLRQNGERDYRRGFKCEKIGQHFQEVREKVSFPGPFSALQSKGEIRSVHCPKPKITGRNWKKIF